jgi:hypothetical protein
VVNSDNRVVVDRRWSHGEYDQLAVEIANLAAHL